MDEAELQRVWILRKLLHDMEDLPAIEFMMKNLKDSKATVNFLVR